MDRSRGRQAFVLLLAAISVAAIGWLDLVSGRVPDLTVLYLIPIAAVTYEAGLWAGGPLAIAALAVSVIVHPAEAGPMDAILDGLTHFGVFLLSAVAVNGLATQLRTIRAFKTRRDQELELAASVQSKMLPPPDLFVPGLDIGHEIGFARELGGDYYAIREAFEGTLVCVADISGKGVSAALFTSVLHDAISQALRFSADPSHVVSAANRRLLPITPDYIFVTLFCAFIAEDLSYSSAGHEPVLLLRKGAIEPEELRSTGTIPVGITEEDAEPSTRTPFQDGDALLAVTDGITESTLMGPDPRRRLKDLFVQNAGSTAQEIADRVFAEATGEPGAPTRDDAVVVCVKRESNRQSGQSIAPLGEVL